jgi:hypothetical protein
MRLNVFAQVIRKMTVAALAPAALMLAMHPAAVAQINNSPERIEFTIDVAEDMNLFVEPRVPVGTEPLRGSFFVTEGKIFPAYTIPTTGGDQFDPQKVTGDIGRWFCKGTFLVSGSVFDKSAQSVLTDQLYLLADDKRSIATTGIEGNSEVVRAVIGGTGPYAGYTGEQTQQFLGFNKTGGVNLRVTVRLRKTTNYAEVQRKLQGNRGRQGASRRYRPATEVTLTRDLKGRSSCVTLFANGPRCARKAAPPPTNRGLHRFPSSNRPAKLEPDWTYLRPPRGRSHPFRQVSGPQAEQLRVRIRPSRVLPAPAP